MPMSSIDQGGGKRRGGISISRLPFFWRFAPLPFAGLPIVAGDTTLYHFVAPLVSYHDERDEIAAAKANRAKTRHDHELRYLTHRSVSLRQTPHLLDSNRAVIRCNVQSCGGASRVDGIGT
jgi:hypothetical protein